MTNPLKKMGKDAAARLIINQVCAEIFRQARPPLGGVRSLPSIPLCVTPFSILASPRVKIKTRTLVSTDGVRGE